MKVSILIISFIFVASIRDCSTMFECIMTQFEPIVKNSPILNLDNIKIIRFNRTTLVSNGSFVFHYEGSIRDAEVLCNSYKKAGNEYRLSPYKVGPVNMCKGLAEDQLFFPAFHQHTNFPPIESCDFKSGTIYYIKNYLPDMSKVPPVFASGDYMLECKINNGDEFIQGFKTYAQIYNIANVG